MKMQNVKPLALAVALTASSSLTAQTVYFDDGTVYDLLPSESLFIAPADTLYTDSGVAYDFEFTAPVGFVPASPVYDTAYEWYQPGMVLGTGSIIRSVANPLGAYTIDSTIDLLEDGYFRDVTEAAYEFIYKAPMPVGYETYYDPEWADKYVSSPNVLDFPADGAVSFGGRP
jgi:hypothetical protein